MREETNKLIVVTQKNIASECAVRLNATRRISFSPFLNKWRLAEAGVVKGENIYQRDVASIRQHSR